MLYPSLMLLVRGLRKCYRYLLFIIIFMLITIGMLALFCMTLLERDIIRRICKSHSQNKTSGALCKELCSEVSAFSNYNCIHRLPDVFTTERNGNVYEFQVALGKFDDLVWRDKHGKKVYPKSSDLYHMIKMHLLVNYNVTLEDNVLLYEQLKGLINPEVDEYKPSQMRDFWYLFNNDDYVMSKLFEDEAIFPTILGNCRNLYAKEQLIIPFKSKSGGSQRYLNFKTLYEYVLRLDMIKPDPVKICKIDLNNFGLTADKRVKAVNARYMKLESQLHKKLASGKSCGIDADCQWHDCRGRCEQRMCIGAPKQENVQLLCAYVTLFPDRFQYFQIQPQMRRLYEDKCKRKFATSFW